MEESAQKLLPPNIACGSSSGSGQSTETRSVKTPSKDAQGRVTGHLLSQRPFGICHTRSFSFSLGPCLWVSPWHVVRQTMGRGAIEVIFRNLWDACFVTQGYLVSLKPICLGLGSEWSLWPHLQKTDVLTTRMMSLEIPEPLQPLVLTAGQVVITPHHGLPSSLAKRQSWGRVLHSLAKQRWSGIFALNKIKQDRTSGGTKIRVGLLSSELLKK